MAIATAASRCISPITSQAAAARCSACGVRSEPHREGLSGRETQIVAHLHRNGASFFGPLHEAAGGGFPQETVDAIWDLVWKGLLTNDTLHALRAYSSPPERTRRPGKGTTFRSRRLIPPSAEGRWTLVPPPAASTTTWATAMANQLLVRHGVVTRDVTAIEQLPGGFSSMYPVLRRLEETGRIRRGYFVAGLGAAQFAQPGAVDLLRDMRDDRDEIVTVTISATDPANPYGVLIPWPMSEAAPISRGATTDRRRAGHHRQRPRRRVDRPRRSAVGRLRAG